MAPTCGTWLWSPAGGSMHSTSGVFVASCGSPSLHMSLTSKSAADPLNHQWPKPSTSDAWDCSGTLPARIRCRTTLVLYLPVSATLRGIGYDPVVVRDKRGFVPRPPRTEYGTVDCLVLRTGSCSVAKSHGNSYAPVGARDMMMMMMRISYQKLCVCISRTLVSDCSCIRNLDQIWSCSILHQKLGITWSTIFVWFTPKSGIQYPNSLLA